MGQSALTDQLNNMVIGAWQKLGMAATLQHTPQAIADIGTGLDDVKCINLQHIPATEYYSASLQQQLPSGKLT